MAYSVKKIEFSFWFKHILFDQLIFFLLYTILSVADFFAPNYVIHVRTLHHINDDVV